MEALLIVFLIIALSGGRVDPASAAPIRSLSEALRDISPVQKWELRVVALLHIGLGVWFLLELNERTERLAHIVNG